MTTYRMLWDLHTHTTYSHGTGSIEDNVRAAREAGLAAIGISDHGPDHKLYGVKEKLLPEMKSDDEAVSMRAAKAFRIALAALEQRPLI